MSCFPSTSIDVHATTIKLQTLFLKLQAFKSSTFVVDNCVNKKRCQILHSSLNFRQVFSGQWRKDLAYLVKGKWYSLTNEWRLHQVKIEQLGKSWWGGWVWLCQQISWHFPDKNATVAAVNLLKVKPDQTHTFKFFIKTKFLHAPKI